MKLLKVLISLGKKGALSKTVMITTVDLGKELNIPQQTMSRLLIKLADSELITREKGIKGYMVRITEKGREFLKNLKDNLEEILEKKEMILKMEGKVTNGLKDGKYYLSFNEYRKEIESKLGYKPFLGTLNIKLDSDSTAVKERLQNVKGVEIQGFKKDGKIFGSAKFFKCKINKVNAHIIIPSRSHYGSDILEIIAPFSLRRKLKIKNGDEIVVEVIR